MVHNRLCQVLWFGCTGLKFHKSSPYVKQGCCEMHTVTDFTTGRSLLLIVILVPFGASCFVPLGFNPKALMLDEKM